MTSTSKVAENQISSLETAKLKLHVNHTKKTTLDNFVQCDWL